MKNVEDSETHARNKITGESPFNCSSIQQVTRAADQPDPSLSKKRKRRETRKKEKIWLVSQFHFHFDEFSSLWRRRKSLRKLETLRCCCFFVFFYHVYFCSVWTQYLLNPILAHQTETSTPPNPTRPEGNPWCSLALGTIHYFHRRRGRS